MPTAFPGGQDPYARILGKPLLLRFSGPHFSIEKGRERGNLHSLLRRWGQDLASQWRQTPSAS